MEDKVIVSNFWPPYWDGNRPELMASQLGWPAARRADAGSDDIKDNFDYHICHLNFDLCFYFPETDKFYYADIMNNDVLIIPEREDWDGKYYYDRVASVWSPPDFRSSECLLEFDEPQEIWDKLIINGKNLEYILAHSVIWLGS